VRGFVRACGCMRIRGGPFHYGETSCRTPAT